MNSLPNNFHSEGAAPLFFAILVKEVFEFHRFRIRDRDLETIDQKIQSIYSVEALVDYWNSLKYELFSFRAHLGKEYELLIAQFINQKLEEMRLKAAE